MTFKGLFTVSLNFSLSKSGAEDQLPKRADLNFDVAEARLVIIFVHAFFSQRAQRVRKAQEKHP
jgi:hypothetical protein